MISTGNSAGTELVVLSDEEGRPIGVASKATVHTDDTPLHLAFSAYLLDASGSVLLTRRALGKKTWPGVWTNSFCGHPGPGEPVREAIVRRLGQELGVDEGCVVSVEEVLPDFRYRARDSSGLVEHEICPVFMVTLAEGTALEPSPGEVDAWEWVAPENLLRAVGSLPGVFSPWMVEQLGHRELGEALLRGRLRGRS
ncbi:isopentenyl-diphosphate Delta-isomerase [Corynebacterium mastitidis]|uniref:Isopentenyl-diphosphate Delta-isomerase n=1 Tax=Corynebacterium mastitidis TaxID=161890 RepID=A0ABU8NWN9_9CORY